MRAYSRGAQYWVAVGRRAVLICGVHGLDAMTRLANTGCMARTVLILGLDGVQALDTTSSDLGGVRRRGDRVDAACAAKAIRDVHEAIEAQPAGMHSTETLRRNFVRLLGISPEQYRQTFV